MSSSPQCPCGESHYFSRGRHLKKQLGHDVAITSETITDSDGPGNAVLIGRNWENVCELIIAHGERGRTSESVVRNAVKDFTRYQNAPAPVGRRLADQLLYHLHSLAAVAFEHCRSPIISKRTGK